MLRECCKVANMNTIFSLILNNMRFSLFLLALMFSWTLFSFTPAVTTSAASFHYSALLTIDGKTTHSYTVDYLPKGDTIRRVTSYFDDTKRLVRQETSVYIPQTLMLFTNKIEDFRTGEYLLQTNNGNRFIAQHRERFGDKIAQKSISSENAILSTLVAERIQQSMEELERGQTSTFTIALPLHGITADMSLEKVHTEIINGIPCSTIKLAPSNVFFRIVMGEPAYFSYERAKPHRLIQYKGILGLPSPEGKQQRGLAKMLY